MKKITMFLFSLVAIFALASCDLDSSTTIEFKNLPETVYKADEYSPEKVKEFLAAITVKVSEDGEVEKEVDLTNDLLKVSGFNEETLKAAGNYTLVVEFNSASISFSYSVVAQAEPTEVSDASGLKTALEKGGVIKLTQDIDLEEEVLSVNTDVVIYGNGFTVSSAGGRTFQMNSANQIKVIMYNLNIVNTGVTTPLEGDGTDYPRALSIGSSASVELVLDGCKLTSDWYCLNVLSRKHSVPSTITVKNSRLEGLVAINVWSNGATFNVEKSELISTWTSTTASFGAIVLNGGAKDPENLGLKAGQTGQNNIININNSKVTCEHRDAYGFAVVIQNACANNTINFNSTEVEYNADRIYLPDGYVPVANRFNIDGVRQ